jgi:hypothetical protein
MERGLQMRSEMASLARELLRLTQRLTELIEAAERQGTGN